MTITWRIDELKYLKCLKFIYLYLTVERPVILRDDDPSISGSFGATRRFLLEECPF